MILGLDIGNTHTVTGLFSMDGRLLLSFRVASDEKLTEDEFFAYFKTIADFNNIKLEKIEGIVISSVVPGLTTIFLFFAKKYFKIDPVIIDSSLPLPIKYDIDNPKELGADRLTNIVSATLRYPDKNLLILDFGTATKFEVIINKTYMGGLILPGVNLSINALFKNTAKLPKIRLEKPRSVIGKNTVEHINAGIYFGYIGQVKEIISRIKLEYPDVYIISTGGLSDIISSEISDIKEFRPNLTLEGLYDTYNYLKKAGELI